MATFAYDSRSFTLDGKRLWLVAGTMSFQSCPPAEWPARLHGAKLLGLNTVDVPVFWHRVEPRPGVFDWTGPNDIRSFLKLAKQFGLFVILRPGPYVGHGADLGGMPSWLLDVPGMQVRTANAPFLEACSRYLNALAGQVRDQQVQQGGPIVLIQTEAHWTCGDEPLAEGYLGELTRFMRESGLTVPKMNANNLWAGAEGDLDAWAGHGEMISTIRQLNAVRPHQPRVITDFGSKTRITFGVATPDVADPLTLQRQIVQVLAGAGQYVLTPCVAMNHPGFWGGQSSFADQTLIPGAHETACSIDSAGLPTAYFGPVRRASLFASTFGRLFSHLDPSYQPIALAPIPGSDRTRARPAGWTVSHARGEQGSVVCLFSVSGQPQPGTVELMLPDGSTVPVATGGQSCHWCVIDYHLSARAHLDLSTLCVLAHRNDMLVVFGAGGSEGQVVINGAPLEVSVPKGLRPSVVVHENTVVVVCSEEAADTAFFDNGSLVVGAAWIDEAGRVHTPASRKPVKISGTGEVAELSLAKPGAAKPGAKGKKASGSKTVKKAGSNPAPGAAASTPGAASCPGAGPANGAVPHRPLTRHEPHGACKLDHWEAAPAQAYAEGTSPRYATIAGPTDLSKLGSPYGYGWYRAVFRSGNARKPHVMSPGSGDRLHVFSAGAFAGVVGRGPGGHAEVGVPLKRGDCTLVVLADNAGRLAGGSVFTGRRGMVDHLHEVSKFDAGKAKAHSADPIDLLDTFRPLFWTRRGEGTHPTRLSWTFVHRRQSDLWMSLPAADVKYLVLLNGRPISYADGHRSVATRLGDETGLERGKNVLEIAFGTDGMPRPQADAAVETAMAHLGKHASFLELIAPVTEGGAWAFAKWEPPAESDYASVSRAKLGSLAASWGGPTWWKARLDVPTGDPAPVYLDLKGMTKGQVYLNGHNVGRYFVGVAGGAAVPPSPKVLLPAELLTPGAHELVLFDEHAGDPGKIHVVSSDGPSA